MARGKIQAPPSPGTRPSLMKLDANFAPKPLQLTFRYRWLTTLPEDYSGERHIAVVTKPPADSEEPWEFQARPGPGPTEPLENSFTVYLAR